MTKLSIHEIDTEKATIIARVEAIIVESLTLNQELKNIPTNLTLAEVIKRITSITNKIVILEKELITLSKRNCELNRLRSLITDIIETEVTGGSGIDQ